MNNNFTHKEFKSFVSKLSDLLSLLPGLPAGRRFAVNFLLVQYHELLKVPAISKIFINKKPALKLKPVFVANGTCDHKKQVNSFYK